MHPAELVRNLQQDVFIADGPWLRMNFLVGVSAIIIRGGKVILELSLCSSSGGDLRFVTLMTITNCTTSGSVRGCFYQSIPANDKPPIKIVWDRYIHTCLILFMHLF